MKQTTNTFTFNFNTNGQKNTSISLPKKFENIFNTMSRTSDAHNSIQELSCFCDEYLDLSGNDRAKLKEIITTGIVDWRLNTFHDLRILVRTIGEFEVVRNIRNVTQLGKSIIGDDDGYTEVDFDEIGAIFFKKTKGIFHPNGNYYYINKIK